MALKTPSVTSEFFATRINLFLIRKNLLTLIVFISIMKVLFELRYVYFNLKIDTRNKEAIENRKNLGTMYNWTPLSP